METSAVSLLALRSPRKNHHDTHAQAIVEEPRRKSSQTELSCLYEKVMSRNRKEKDKNKNREIRRGRAPPRRSTAVETRTIRRGTIGRPVAAEVALGHKEIEWTGTETRREQGHPKVQTHQAPCERCHAQRISVGDLKFILEGQAS